MSFTSKALIKSSLPHMAKTNCPVYIGHTSMRCVSILSVSICMSVLGALLKLSLRYCRAPAAFRKLSAAHVIPALVLRSCNNPLMQAT